MFPPNRLPKGVRIIPPETAKVKHRLEEKARKVLEEKGYAEIITPTFEYAEIFKKVIPQTDGFFEFSSPDGEKLSLRYDMTIPIARHVAVRPPEKLPVRYYYIANVFRFVEPREATYREFWQVGAELIGGKEFSFDEEVLFIACELLREMGCKRVVFDIGHVGFLRKAVSNAGFEFEKLAEFFRRKNREAIKKYAPQLLPLIDYYHDVQNVSLKEIESLAKSVGTSSQDLDCIAELIESAKKLYAEFRSKNFDLRVCLDLGLVRNPEMYSGVFFEVFVENAGFPVAGGGRYDGLIKRLGGPDIPATGFAIGLDRLMFVVFPELR